jgi:hypothetical protein
MPWNYNSEDYDPNASGGTLPIGDYRVRIKEVVPKVAKSGNDMWELTLEVSGRNNYLWYYLVFLNDNPGMTNQKLGDIFTSFAIPQGEMDRHKWIGKVGGAKVKHDDYGSKVHYFLKRDKVDALPAWVEPQRSGGVGVTTSAATPALPGPPDDFAVIAESEDLPF